MIVNVSLSNNHSYIYPPTTINPSGLARSIASTTNFPFKTVVLAMLTLSLLSFRMELLQVVIGG